MRHFTVRLATLGLLVIQSFPGYSCFCAGPSRRLLPCHFCPNKGHTWHQVARAQAKRKEDDDEVEDSDEDSRNGMARAFRELDALESLGDKSKEISNKTPEILDKGFENVMKQLEPLKDDLNASPPPPPEAEVKLYSDMVRELEKDDDSKLYSNMLSDMGGTPESRKSAAVKEETETFSSDRSAEDMDAFMNKALEEAVAEARRKTPEELAASAENILDDKDMMKEIEQVFEKANKELLDSLEVIRKEQEDLAKASAEKSAQERMQYSQETAQRLEIAEASMSKMLEKVDKETKEVEKAVQDLKAAEAELSKDPLVKLKEGGVVKQGALAGTLLFTVRSFVETVAMAGPDGESHVAAALIQGALAVVCAVYFFLF